MAWRIVPTASQRPGRCAISGDTKGPFIDTSKIITRYGRIYISLHFLQEPMEHLGYLSPDRSKALRDKVENLEKNLSTLEPKAETLDSLMNYIGEFLPQEEPEVVYTEKVVTRAPTDEEIEVWIAEYGADSEVVQNAQKLEPGSTEEWNKLYRNNKSITKATEAKSLPSSEETLDPRSNEEDRFFTLMDQELDLDKVLSETVSTITEFLEGKEDNFVEAVVTREFTLAEQSGRKVRKGILEPQGYWEEETDSPIHPSDVIFLDENDKEEEENEGENKNG